MVTPDVKKGGETWDQAGMVPRPQLPSLESVCSKIMNASRSDLLSADLRCGSAAATRPYTAEDTIVPKVTYTMYDGILKFFSSDLMGAVKQESDDKLRKLAEKVTADMGSTFDLGLFDTRATPTHLYSAAEFFGDKCTPSALQHLHYIDAR